MTNIINEEGKKYNNIKIIKRLNKEEIKEINKKSSRPLYKCECFCGNIFYSEVSDIKRGQKKSCGCLKKKHGKSKTGVYYSWISMISRCNNKNNKYYYNYGGRGIEVCDEWLDFLNFEKWAICNNYKEGLSIDRIDNNGNYEPNNCKWSTAKEQANNRRSSIILEVDGLSMTVEDWSFKLGISKSAIYQRRMVNNDVKYILKEYFEIKKDDE